MDRRQLLRIGVAAAGGLAPSAAAAAPRPARPGGRPRARACILLFMDGGNSHIDTFDPKPDAPAEVRGPFRPIATTVPGLAVGEHLPLTARQMHRIAMIRSVTHDEVFHEPAVYGMLTGRRHPIPRINVEADRGDFPGLGPLLARLDPADSALPGALRLTEVMRIEGRVVPGQDAGRLGPAADPPLVEVTPEGRVVPPEFALADPNPPARRARRAALLSALEGDSSTPGGGGYDRLRRQALELLDRPAARECFDLDREPARVRERYGPDRHGRSVLLARRLVEAGARFVAVPWGRRRQDWADGRPPQLAFNPWDTHSNHFPLLARDLLPPADRALSALVEDLAARGMLDETLVVWMGDFGRTPRINREAGRDHWPRANTVLLAGAGLPGGAVVGRTDRIGGEVVADPVTPADLVATILALLGVDPGARYEDAQGVTHRACDGRPIAQLLGHDHTESPV